MAKTPTPPAKDEFEAWLTTTERARQKCKTCQESPEVLNAIQRFWERAQTGASVPSQAQLHEFVHTHYGYPWTLAAMTNHLRNCVPTKRRLKSE